MKKQLNLIFLLLFSAAAFVTAQSQDEELARLYARHAWDAYRSSRLSDFRDLLDTGLEYDDENPDLLCLKGLDARSSGRYGEAGNWFTRAFYSGNQPEQIDTGDILGWLFEMQYRLGNDEDLESLFFTVNEISRDTSDILFYTVLSLHRLGKKDRAFTMAEEGVYRYQDQRFLILLSSWSSEEYYPGVLAEYADRQGLRYPDLLSRVVMLPESENREALASLYLTQYNDLNSWYFRKYVLGYPSGNTSIPYLSDTNRVWPLKALQHYLNDYPDMSYMMSRMQNVMLDGSGDGITDLRIYRKGSRVLWEYDRDQDGIADTVLVWSGQSLLESVTFHDNDLSRTFHYYDYPFVDRVSITGAMRNHREYNFLPGSFGFPLTKNTNDLHVQILMDPRQGDSIYIPESEILGHSFSLIDSVTGEEPVPFREYTVVDGMIRRFREDSNFDGRFDRTVLLDNWLPYEGYRDIDNDGAVDLKEKYIDG
ncbi:MAG: hypothetical protein PQJ50_17095, partial [Spirochaetales bacterium]|nr:hypothetical protein [Spirochaetales bacterium]